MKEIRFYQSLIHEYLMQQKFRSRQTHIMFAFDTFSTNTMTKN